MKKTQKVLELEKQFNSDIKDILLELYSVQKLDSLQIAKVLNISDATIRRWIRKFGIPYRSKSEAFKIKWQNPEYKKKASRILKETRNQPEVREKLSKRTKQLWSNPTYKERVSHAMRVANANPKVRQKRSKSNSDRWHSPEFRKHATQTMKDLWNNNDYRENMIEKSKTRWQNNEWVSQMFSKLAQSPNNPEQLLSRLTPLNIKFVGNRSFWRRIPPDKRPSNPDFIIEPIKKTRKVIFFHGIYWHRDELHNRGQDLIDAWEKIGYNAMIIWEDELNDLDNLMKRIAEFIGQSTWQLSLF